MKEHYEGKMFQLKLRSNNFIFLQNKAGLGDVK